MFSHSSDTDPFGWIHRQHFEIVLAITLFSTIFSTLFNNDPLIINIFHIFASMFSKSSDAVVLYVENGKNCIWYNKKIE